MKNDELARWQEPMLPLYEERTRISEPGIKRRLFLIPSNFGEDFDPNFSPTPTPQDELPEISAWVRQFTVRLLEILSARRSPHQLARWTHRTTFTSLLTKTKSFTIPPQIIRVHIRQPLESLAEVSVILSYRSRTRALVMRFEGVDRRWICTVIELL
jgi:hypothetical protein